MTYNKNDILIFMTNAPIAHAYEMIGEPVDKNEIEKKEFYGFVKSVISHKDGIYLMRTVKPLSGLICVAEAADIIRQVDKSELTEDELEHLSDPLSFLTEVPNVYIPTQDEANVKLIDEERCFALAQNAMRKLFPEIQISSMDLRLDMFTKSEKINNLNRLEEYIDPNTDESQRAELDKLKNKTLDYFKTKRFKEYYTVQIGTPGNDDLLEEYFPKLAKKHNLVPVSSTNYWTVAVSKEFDEVCVLRDVNERSNFFRSLGPEFDEMDEACNYYRDKIFETARP